MKSIKDEEIIKNIRLLYKSSNDARKIFDHLAKRTKNSETSAQRLSVILDIDYYNIIHLMKKLQDIGCGTFIAGRRSYPSRFQWAYDLSSLGHAAMGEIETLDIADVVQENTLDDDEEIVDNSSKNAPLTIPEAKRLLAEALDITPDKIEIIIRT